TSWSAPDGSLWVSRDGKLWHLPADAGPDPASRTPMLEAEGTIQRLHFGPGGLVWVLTLRDGLYRLNRARVDLLGTTDGLPGGNVYGISRDAHGTIWLGTLDHGLIAVDADGTIRRTGAESGLPGPNPWVVA